ncbi:hypothetical protein [Fodinicurvata sp. EGI_FJ10296]|uniref:hypothetical protein n=1 Tax=Fodinicurvata sp. EGI_FJ10296 TaxID=3231908 RepID=UPI0034570B11
MQVQQSLTLMRQAIHTLFRPPSVSSVDSADEAAATRGAERAPAEAPAPQRKGAAKLPPGVVGFIAERFHMPASTLGLPRGYFIDIRV